MPYDHKSEAYHDLILENIHTIEVGFNVTSERDSRLVGSSSSVDGKWVDYDRKDAILECVIINGVEIDSDDAKDMFGSALLDEIVGMENDSINGDKK